MKILVASDAHGNIDLMLKLIKEYPSMDYYLDAGDSESDSYTLFPYRSVRGNCDYFSFDEKALLRTSAGSIFMRHVPYITQKEKDNCVIFIHGHTHRYKIEMENNLITLCPGSISRSRDSSHGSFAIITINGNKINIDIIDIFTKKILLHF